MKLYLFKMKLTCLHSLYPHFTFTSDSFWWLPGNDTYALAMFRTPEIIEQEERIQNIVDKYLFIIHLFVYVYPGL